jgi:hypothetical protein
MRGIVRLRYQYPAEELKTDYPKTPVPVDRAMALRPAAHPERRSSKHGSRILRTPRGLPGARRDASSRSAA